MNLGSILILVLTMSACSTPQKTAYNTLASVGATADTAMGVAATLRHEGKISREQWTKVGEYFVKYQAAYNTACDVAAVDYSKLAPNDVIALANDFINLVNSFK